jgi:hypothetical protein
MIKMKHIVEIAFRKPEIAPSPTPTADAILLIPDFDPEEPEQYPGNIQPGYYNSEQMLQLIGANANNPQAILFIAEMLDDGGDPARRRIAKYLLKNRNNPQAIAALAQK